MVRASRPAVMPDLVVCEDEDDVGAGQGGRQQQHEEDRGHHAAASCTALRPHTCPTQLCSLTGLHGEVAASPGPGCNKL
jgi:hypothetical protein